VVHHTTRGNSEPVGKQEGERVSGTQEKRLLLETKKKGRGCKEKQMHRQQELLIKESWQDYSETTSMRIGTVEDQYLKQKK